MELPRLLQDFKAAYDGMDAKGIAGLFADYADFQGTAETEYREVLWLDVAAYFQKIADARSAQTLIIESYEQEDNNLSVLAAFASKDTNGAENPTKPVKFTIKTELIDGGDQIVEFKSEPR